MACKLGFQPSFKTVLIVTINVRRHVESLIYHTEDKELRMRRGWLMYRTYHPRMPVDWCRMCSELTFDEWYGKEKDTAFSYATDDGKERTL